ncbi:MAG TPA: TlpA disulfide reductase family protein, partial [Candidatus Binataceae bacterium]
LLVSPVYAGGKKKVVAAPASVSTPAQPAPAKPQRKLLSFTLTDLNGRRVKLSAWRGHPLVVDFWATWCPPCRKEVPELNAIYRKYRARGLVVVGVSVDKVQGDGVKSVRPFAREFKVNYPILMADDALVEAMDLDNIPTTLFIDRKGKTVARLEGRGKSGELAQAAKTLFRD